MAQPAAGMNVLIRLTRGFATWLLCALVLLRAAGAAADASQDWLTYYYMDQDTAVIGPAIRDLAREGVLNPGPAEAPIASFFSEIFRAHPNQAVGWIEAGKLDAEQRAPLIKALWLAGLKQDAVKLARLDDWPQRDIEKLGKPPPDRFGFRISDPSHLDMMWADFMATGDTRYVVRIIDVLDYSVAEGDAGLPVMQLRSSARWSLASNSAQHELVYRTVRTEAARRHGLAKEVLEGIVQEVRDHAQAFPTRDGAFSALLFVTDDADFRRRWTEFSVTEVPEVKSTAKVGRGRRVEVELVCTGMGLDEGLNADVVYDVVVLRPDGTPYAELPGLPAAKGRRASSFMVSLAETGVDIEFDPPDAPGTYLIKATVRDRVGKRVLELSVPLELAVP
jgi:hypothetical protein